MKSQISIYIFFSFCFVALFTPQRATTSQCESVLSTLRMHHMRGPLARAAKNVYSTRYANTQTVAVTVVLVVVYIHCSSLCAREAD